MRRLVSVALIGGLVFGALPSRAQETKPPEPAPAPAQPAPPPAAAPVAGTPGAAPPPAPEPPPPSMSPPAAAAAATPEPAHASGGSAYGMVLQVRMPVGETFVRSFQGPERAQDTTHPAQLAGPRGVYDVPFVNSTYYVFNGFRLPAFTVGLGFGFHHFSWEVDTPCIDPNTGAKFACRGIPAVVSDGTIFQFAPAIMVPYFATADGKVEAYWTAAFMFTWGPNITPQYDPYDPTSGTGNFVEPDINAVAIGLGGSLGLGGQYFLHRNFALGVESGIFYHHLTVTATATYTDPITGGVHSLDAVPDQKGWFLGGYAALTAMVVVGP